MHDEIYLETDEEVTSAIEKIKKSKKRHIALCLPGHSQLGQSIVNLKLIFKEARAGGKEVSLVSPDTSIRNLAERVGFSVFGKVKDIHFTSKMEDVKPTKKSSDIKQKQREEPDEEKKDEETAEELEEHTDDDPSADGEKGEGLKAAGFTSQSVSQAAADAAGEKVDPDTQVPADWKDDTDNEDTSPREDHKSSPSTGASQVIPTRGNLRLFRKKKRAIWIPIISIVLVLIGAGVAAALFIPNATVKMSVFAQPFNETVKSSVDTAETAINPDKATIPGKAVPLEQTTKSSTKATGKKDLGEKAKGSVTIYNEWDSSVHSFPAGTMLRAANGNEFVLNEAVAVPGASSAVVAGSSVVTAGKKEAAVTASSPGENYNANPTTFTIPSLPKAQQEKIYATSSAAFSGGTTRLVTVVAQSDIDTVLTNVKKLNVEEAIKKIKEQAGETIVLDAAIQTLSQEASTTARPEAEAESIEGSVTGSFRVITFSKNDQTELLEKLLEGKIPDGQKIVSQGEGLTLDLSQFELNLVSETRIDLTNNLKAFTATRFDENKIRRDLIGATKNDVRAEVEKNNVPLDTVEATVTPKFWPRMPLNGSKIKLEITYKEKPAGTEPKKEE